MTLCDYESGNVKKVNDFSFQKRRFNFNIFHRFFCKSSFGSSQNQRYISFSIKKNLKSDKKDFNV